jgi:hypothetical protein
VAIAGPRERKGGPERSYGKRDDRHRDLTCAQDVHQCGLGRDGANGDPSYQGGGAGLLRAPCSTG